MASVGNVFITISADNKNALRALDQTKKKVGSVGDSLKTLKSAFIALGGLLVFKDILKTFGDFEQAVKNAASVTGQFGDELKATEKNINSVSKELGKTTVFSASQAANAFYDLASAGYDVANMTTDELKPVLDLAAATQSDLTQTTQTVTGALASLGLGMESSNRVADVFTKTIGSSKATLDKINQSYQYVGAALQGYNVELEDANGALAVLYNRTLDGSRAGNVLRNVLNKTSAQTSKGKKVLASYGLSMEDVNVETRGLIPVLETLRDAQISNADASALFGSQYGSLAKTLFDNIGEVKDLTATLKDSGGTAKEVAKNQLNSFNGTMQLLRSNVESLKIAIGESLTPVLRQLAVVIGGIASNEKIQSFFQGLFTAIALVAEGIMQFLVPAGRVLFGVLEYVGGMIGNLLEYFGLVSTESETMSDKFGVLGEVLKVFGGVIGALGLAWGVYTVATKAAAAATAIANAILAAIPVGWIAIAIAGLIAAVGALVVAWRTNFGEIQEKTKKVLEYIQEKFGWLIDGIKQAWNVIYTVGKKAMEALWGTIKSVVGFIYNYWVAQFTEIGRFLKGLIQIITGNFKTGFKNIIKAVGNLAKNFVAFWWEAIKAVGKFLLSFAQATAGVFGDLIRLIGAVIVDLASQWKTILSNMLIMIDRWAKGVWDAVENIDWDGALKSFASAVGNVLKSALNAVRNWAKKAWEWVTSIFSGKEADLDASVNVEVQTLSSEQKKTLFEDLSDGLDDIKFTRTEKVLGEIGEKYAGIFEQAQPEINVDTSAAEKGMENLQDVTADTIDVAADLGDTIDKATNGDGGGGSAKDTPAGNLAEITEEANKILRKALEDSKKSILLNDENIETITSNGKLLQTELEEIAGSLKEMVISLPEEDVSGFSDGAQASFSELAGKVNKAGEEIVKMGDEFSDLKDSKFTVDDLGDLTNTLAEAVVDSTSAVELLEDAFGALYLNAKDTISNLKDEVTALKDAMDTETDAIDYEIDKEKVLQKINKANLDLEEAKKENDEAAIKRAQERLDKFKKEQTQLELLRRIETGAASFSGGALTSQEDIARLNELDKLQQLQIKKAIIRAEKEAEIAKAQEKANSFEKLTNAIKEGQIELAGDQVSIAEGVTGMTQKQIQEYQNMYDVFSQSTDEQDSQYANQLRNLAVTKKQYKTEKAQLEELKVIQEQMQEVFKKYAEEEKKIKQEQFDADVKAIDDLLAAHTDLTEEQKSQIESVKNQNISAIQQVINNLNRQKEEANRATRAWLAAAAAKAAASGGGYAGGGYTGSGAIHEVAGVVHRGEYVIPNKVLKKLRPTGLLGVLERMRHGFFDGGMTSPQPIGSTIGNSVQNTVNLDVKQNVSDRSDLIGAGEELFWLFQQRLAT